METNIKTERYQVKLVQNLYKMRYLIVCLTIAILGVFFVFSKSSQALTTVPTKMNFQGRLADSAGNIKTNGTYNMRLKLFTVATGGTNVWSEDRLVSATQGITVTNGIFAIQLGEITPLPASLFGSGPLYLEVEFPTPASATTSSPVWTEGAMTPRNQMATSAYAYNADTVDGLDSIQLARIDADNYFTGLQNFTGNTFAINGAAHAAKFNVGAIFNVDTSNSKVYVGASDATGTLFVLDTKNTAGDPTGENGAMYYNSNAGKFRCFQNGVWADCVGGAGGGGDVFLANANTFTNTNTIATTSATAFRIQTTSGSATLLTADTSSMTVTIGAVDANASILVLDTKNTAGDPAGTAGALYYNSSLGKFRCYQGAAWTDCIGSGGGGGGLTRKVNLVPEYAGAVISPDGSNNSGTFTSDYDSVNTHNYYGWTNSTATLNDYDVVVRTAIPSEYASGFGTFRLWAYGGSTNTSNNNIQVTVKDASGTTCANNVSILPGTAATWAEQSVTLAGCTFAANGFVTVIVNMSSLSNNAVRIGEMSYQYTN